MSNDLIVQQKAKSLQSLLQASKSQIEMALPKHLTADRLLRIAMTECRKNPALLECTQVSFIGAIIQTAQLGLEPNAAMGHSYLIPFNNRKTGNKEVQFIIGYRGMLELAYRSPKVNKIVARSVYDGDKFSYDFGLNEKLEHVPAQDGSGNKLTHVYCIVELQNGVRLFDVMTRREVDEAMARSKSSDYGPWKTDFEAMAKKSVIRRFFKFMPSSIEIQQAVGLDEAAERGEQNNGAIVEAVGVHIDKTDHTEEFKNNLTVEQDPVEVDVAPQIINPAVKTITPKKSASAIPTPAVEQIPLDQNGEFANFEKKTSTMDRSKIILSIMDVADTLRVTKDQINERCKRDFGVEMNGASMIQLEELNNKLKDEYNSRLIK